MAIVPQTPPNGHTRMVETDWVTGESRYNVAALTAEQIQRIALSRAAAQARQALPETLHARVAKALELASTNHVERHTASDATVLSSDGSTRYSVAHGQYTCTDWEYAEKHLCKHRIAARLVNLAIDIAKQLDEGDGMVTLRMEEIDMDEPRTPETTPEPAPAAPQPRRTRKPVTLAASAQTAACEPGYTMAQALAPLDDHIKPYVMPIKGKPYMTVAGQVAMAMDEHRKMVAALTIDTAFVELGGKWVCRASVTSALLGSATGHAVLPLAGTGARLPGLWRVWGGRGQCGGNAAGDGRGHRVPQRVNTRTPRTAATSRGAAQHDEA